MILPLALIIVFVPIALIETMIKSKWIRLAIIIPFYTTVTLFAIKLTVNAAVDVSVSDRDRSEREIFSMISESYKKDDQVVFKRKMALLDAYIAGNSSYNPANYSSALITLESDFQNPEKYNQVAPQ